MRFDSIRVAHMGVLETVDLDLTKIPDACKLVSVHGPNGAGKSTLLELLVGAAYRTMPTRGSLRDVATSRESTLEVGFSHVGQAYKVRHFIDGMTGKAESVVTQEGEPQYSGSKVTSFSQWAAKTLPPSELTLNTTVGVQQGLGFLGSKPAERKSILLRALGVSRYETWAKAASENAREAQQAVRVTLARITDLMQRGADVETLEAALATETDSLQRARIEQDAAAEALVKAESSAREAAVTLANREAHERETRQHQAAAERLREKAADLDTRIRNCEDVLGQRDAIQAAKLERAELTAQLAKLAAQAQQLQQQAFEASTHISSGKQALARLEEQAERVRNEMGRCHETLREAPQVQQAESRHAENAEQIRVIEAELADVRAAIEQHHKARQDLSARRIGSLSSGLRTVAESESLASARKTATETLAADAAATDITGLSELEARLGKATSEHQARTREASQIESLRSKRGQLQDARERLGDLEKQERETQAAIVTTARELQEATEKQTAAEASLAPVREEMASHATRDAELAPLAAKAEQIEKAESLLSSRREEAESVRSELARIEQTIQDLGQPPQHVPMPDVDGARHAAKHADDALVEAKLRVSSAEQSLTQARADARRVAELKLDQVEQEAELADWRRLADDLGKNGLQAAEIAACGPALTEFTNDLLLTCHGPRFSVRIDTQKPSADGKRTLEGCDVTVIDSLNGREAEASTFSGGERVILGEAVSLAISMVAHEALGGTGPTLLIRDESGAALDPENAEVYVRMLRKAVERMGASRCLFVTHSPVAQALADARICVGGGTATVQLGAQW